MWIVFFLCIYCFFSAFSFFYTKKDALFVDKNFVILVLGSQYPFIFKDRLKKGRQVKEKLKKLPLPLSISWLDASAEGKYIFSSNTFEDALGAYRELWDKKIILVTTASHMRRAYHSFLSYFAQDALVCCPTNDLWKCYGPLSPLWWRYVWVNIYKDLKYNGKVL